MLRGNNMNIADSFRHEVQKELPQKLSVIARSKGAIETETDNVFIWTFPDGSKALMRKNEINTLSSADE